MQYKDALQNFAKALKEVDPTQVGKAPDTSPPSIEIQSELSVSDKLRIGTLASRKSNRVLDNKDHFPVITQTQAQSSMVRVLQLSEAPAWYNGTIASLRQEVYDGILSLHPDIQFNVRVPVEQAVALSDGETTPVTKQKAIKDPADVAKKEVKQVSRPTLTSAQVEVALENEETRKIIAGRLMEQIDEQVARIESAKQIAVRLLKKGMKANEFDQLSTYLQQDILHELMNTANTVSASTEDRRLELINRMKNQE